MLFVFVQSVFLLNNVVCIVLIPICNLLTWTVSWHSILMCLFLLLKLLFLLQIALLWTSLVRLLKQGFCWHFWTGWFFIVKQPGKGRVLSLCALEARSPSFPRHSSPCSVTTKNISSIARCPGRGGDISLGENQHSRVYIPSGITGMSGVHISSLLLFTTKPFSKVVPILLPPTGKGAYCPTSSTMPHINLPTVVSLTALITSWIADAWCGRIFHVFWSFGSLSLWTPTHTFCPLIFNYLTFSS